MRISTQKKALYLVRVKITIHFGRKPRNGGRPPKDRKDNIEKSLRGEDFEKIVCV